MSCLPLTGGISKGCDKNTGGVKKIRFTDKDNVTGVTYASPGGNISAFTISGVFYDFEFNRNTSSYTEVMSSDDTVGSQFYTQTITLVLNRREQTKRDTLLLLANFKELVAIVTDENGVNWYLGQENGLTMKTNEGGSGTNKTDRNGYTMTFVGEEQDPALTVSDAALAAVI